MDIVICLKRRNPVAASTSSRTVLDFFDVYPVQILKVEL